MVAKPPRILLTSPLPPPQGGIATWTKEVLASPLHEEFSLKVVNTAPRSNVDQKKRFRWDRVFQAAMMSGELFGKVLFPPPKLIHANTSYYWALARDLPFALSGKPLGAKSVLHMHGGNFHLFLEGLTPKTKKVTLAALRKVDALISITGETTQGLMEDLGLNNTVFLPNFTDASRFDGQPRRNPKANPVKAIFVGWLIPTKGTYELVEAIRQVEGVTVDMVGHATSPSEKARLLAAIDEAGVSDRINIVGAIHHDEIPARLMAADLFVLPTHKEGFPLSVLEAMAAGLPSLISGVGAVPDIVRDGKDGLVVPPKDVPSLVRALRTLVENGERRLEMGESAARRVRAEFDMPVVTRQIGELWRDLIGGK
jgi:glycosyltransferase involved in cell wall biosynthesis